MSRWWRAYDEAVDNPKLCLLSDRAHRAWFNLLCVASANGGALPDIKVIALKLRMSPAKSRTLIAELITARLFDSIDGRLIPHNWDDRQFKSDVTDPTNAQRQKRYRNRHSKTVSAVTDAVTVTPPRVQSTETDSERKEVPANAGTPSKYAFESGIIRLTEKDFNQWKQAFSHLNMPAELISMTEWAGEQGPKRWFNAVANLLTKRDRQAKLAKEKSEKIPEFKWNGIEGVI